MCLGLFNVVSESISPTNEAVDDSSDNDFRSSVSIALGGEEAVEDDEFIRDLDNNDVDRSNGDSANKKRNTTLTFHHGQMYVVCTEYFSELSEKLLVQISISPRYSFAARSSVVILRT